MNDINSFMVYFNLLIGVYITYSAISGKGKAFENDYPKEIKEEIFKFNRTMYFIIGPVLTVLSVLELMKVPYAGWASIILVFVAIVVYLILFYSRYGKVIKEARKKKF